ncbi:MAG: hypothetical protein IJ705_01210, partial [Oscillospiraceae bacterium]|nr:hypothetical protein [Oscillospiraceae bacterium]
PAPEAPAEAAERPEDVPAPPEEQAPAEEAEAAEEPAPTADRGMAPAPETKQLSPEDQIELFLGHMGLWYQGGPEYYPAYVYYTVTDLNRNGRLEVIRSEYRYDTNTSINRFYEIDEAESGVTELDYDLADNGETELSPGLVNAEMPMMCFFRDGLYYYSVPSPGVPNENLEIEYFFMLGIDQMGHVSTEVLAQKWLDRMNDKTSYLRGLEEIGQVEYDGADFFRYSGYDCCECSWDWVLLLEGWETENYRSELRDSWERFVFDTIGILNQ